ncbi:hypothetical protein RUM44_010405 [Polyplax serrata]|uniref:Uncharacterized protein n=1 Tax=Polyplax serrata TaxID=468196 RepID=A0ABR1AWY7_POLSC
MGERNVRCSLEVAPTKTIVKFVSQNLCSSLAARRHVMRLDQRSEIFPTGSGRIEHGPDVVGRKAPDHWEIPAVQHRYPEHVPATPNQHNQLYYEELRHETIFISHRLLIIVAYVRGESVSGSSV